MTANYIPNPSVGQTNPAALPEFAMQMIQQIQNQKAQQQAAQDAQDKEMADQFLKLKPAQQALNIDKLTPGARTHILDTSDYATPPPTDAEQLQTVAAANRLKSYQNPNDPFHGLGPGGNEADLFGALNGGKAAPTSTATANVAQGVYGNPTALAPQMQTRQLIEDKAQMSADQAATTGETTRHNTVEEGQTGPLRAAQTAFEAGPHSAAERARAAQEQATAGLSGAKTQNAILERDPNSPLSKGYIPPLLGGGAPGSAPLDAAPPLVKALINYQYDPSLMRRWKPEQQAAIEAQVQQFDPSFNMANYANRAAIRKDVTAGKTSQNIKSLNTAIQHIYTMDVASKALDNFSGIPLLNTTVNSLKNKASGASGDPAVTNFNTAADAVTAELATAFKGSSGTDQEIKQWRRNINPNMSPEQYKGQVNTLLELLGKRIGAINEKYTTDMGKPPDFDVLNPKSRILLKKMGVDPNSIAAAQADNGPGTQTPAPAAGPAVGTKKQFPNGATGVWDGHGWAAQ
jgi:hypothetical protein